VALCLGLQGATNRKGRKTILLISKTERKGTVGVKKVFKCDRCGVEEKEEVGEFPKNWWSFVITRVKYGSMITDKSIQRITVCDKCDKALGKVLGEELSLPPTSKTENDEPQKEVPEELGSGMIVVRITVNSEK